jgi:hypothetical protein
MQVVAFVLKNYLMFSLHQHLLKQQSYLILVHYQIICLSSSYYFFQFAFLFCPWQKPLLHYELTLGNSSNDPKVSLNLGNP